MECEAVEESLLAVDLEGSDMRRGFLVCLMLVIYPMLCTLLVSSVALVSK